MATFDEYKDAQIKIIAMPCNVDKQGFISAGWIMQLLDLAAGVIVKEFTQNRSVTVSMDKIAFKKPILVGDYLNCYAKIIKVGSTSIKIAMKIDLKRLCKEGFVLIEEAVSAEAVFVSLDANGKKIHLQELSNSL